MFRHSYNESGAMLEALDYKQMVWPGHGVSPNGSHQYIEGEYMLENEYDDILEDHSDYLIRTYLPRIYGSLSPLKRCLLYGRRCSVAYRRMRSGTGVHLSVRDVGESIP